MTGPNGPRTVDEFILQQLENMLAAPDNRLAPTNRHLRLAAAVHLETLKANYTQLSVPAVAKRAGISTATLYRLFPDDNALYEAGYRLGLQQYIDWLSYDCTDPNPLLRLTILLDRRIQVWTRPKAMDALSPLYYMICDRDPKLSDHADPYIKLTSDFWLEQFRRLKNEAYLELEPTYEVFEILIGPLESFLFYETILTDAPYVPQSSKFEDCWRAVVDFFSLYGTPHFHAMRKKMAWDEALATYLSGTSG